MHDGINYWKTYIMDYHSAINRKKGLTPAIAWVDLKSFMLGKKADPKGHTVVFSRL